MSINLVTYANQTVTPTNDAIIYEKAIDQNGIFHGCSVTVSGNTVNITGGYGIVCGREFVIESESIPVTLAPSGTLDGRLYVRLDLADADAPIQLLTATGGTLPPLEQDTDANYVNGAYEMELAIFTVGVSALSGVTETYEIITGSKGWTDYILTSSENTGSFTVSANAAGYKDVSITPPKAGYSPLAIVNLVSAASAAVPISWQFQDSSTARIYARNVTTSSVSQTVYFTVLWIKTT